MINCPNNYGIYREDYSLLVCHPKGELTADMMHGTANCRECIKKPELLEINRFHDLTDISSVNLGYEELSRISDEESRMREAAQPIKACYLVPNTLLYGTIRMYEALISSSGVEVHVSYDIDELAGILGVEKTVLTTEPVANADGKENRRQTANTDRPKKLTNIPHHPKALNKALTTRPTSSV